MGKDTFTVALDMDEPHKNDSTQNSNKCLNILLLGQIGSGKSTFINSLVNYLHFETLEDALVGDLEILIRNRFSLVDDQDQEREFFIEPTVPDVEGESNEVLERGKPATQNPKCYAINWETNGVRRSIRLIDTPGYDNINRIQDMQNFEKMFSFISSFEEIHAICFLLKPDDYRLSLGFRSCMKSLLNHLHKSVVKNILFCFTQTRFTFYKAGDIILPLAKYCQYLKEELDVSIPLGKNTVFCFDNEGIRFQSALNNGCVFNGEHQAIVSDSWIQSVEETRRLLKTIYELDAYKNADTPTLNSIRTGILVLCKPLAEIARVLAINLKLIDDKKKEIDDFLRDGNDLKDGLYLEQVALHAQHIEHPKTVCTATCCVDYTRLDSSSTASVQVVYRTQCHIGCSLLGVQTEICPSQLRECSVMVNEKCTRCGCVWNEHMHMRYEIIQECEKVFEKRLQSGDNIVLVAQEFVNELSEREKLLKLEAENLIDHCARFSVFLKYNSIVPSSDFYCHCVNFLIKEERDKVEIGESDAILQQLMLYKNAYIERVSLLADEDVRVEKIHPLLEEPKVTREFGKFLQEIQDLEISSVRREQNKKIKSARNS